MYDNLRSVSKQFLWVDNIDYRHRHRLAETACEIVYTDYRPDELIGLLRYLTFIRTVQPSRVSPPDRTVITLLSSLATCDYFPSVRLTSTIVHHPPCCSYRRGVLCVLFTVIATHVVLVDFVIVRANTVHVDLFGRH